MQKSIKKTWVWLFILLILFIALSFVLGTNKPKEYPPYLTTSPSPTGVKGFYTYLEEELGTVERLENAPRGLLSEQEQILIMVEPALFSDQTTMDDYIDYMEAGNTILLFKNNLEGMFAISTDYGMVDGETTTIYHSSGEETKATMLSQMRIRPEIEDEIILEDDLGVIAIKREYGEGQLIAVNSPDWLTNKYILAEDNLTLVFKLLEEEDWNMVLFDEYSHRSSQTEGLSDIYPMWLLVGCFQIISITLLWLLYKGKRFGPIQSPREEFVRYSDERIIALAAWYKKGNVYHESLASQSDYLRLLLREKWGISSQAEWKDLKDKLAKRLSSFQEEELSVFLSEFDTVIRKKNLSKQEYLLWSKRIDRVQKEVEKG